MSFQRFIFHFIFVDVKLLLTNNDLSITKNKSCVMNTTAGYVIMYIQNDVMMFKKSFSPN